jgi:ribosomal-protein-alanine N-acetyltransferase
MLESFLERQLPMYVRSMRKGDITQVARIDREAFPTEWPPTNFNRELENRMAYYIVASDGPVVSSPPGNPTAAKQTSGLRERLIGYLKRRRSEPADDEENLLGYSGMWILADEAHIMSIASGQKYRRQGIGEALLIAIVEMAQQYKARIVTLEVRVSNTTAQNLYLKYGFQKTGLRKAYYLDNREDAIIMSTDYIGSSNFKDSLQQLKKDHAKRWGPTSFEIEKTNSGWR